MAPRQTKSEVLGGCKEDARIADGKFEVVEPVGVVTPVVTVTPLPEVPPDGVVSPDVDEPPHVIVPAVDEAPDVVVSRGLVAFILDWTIQVTEGMAESGNTSS